ncbi:hypothetical protein [Thermus phage TSP4]|nr:hypothetical protein [Thermus phage TSP4]
MTRVIGVIYILYTDGTTDSLGNVEYTLNEDYDTVDDVLVFNYAKADPRVGYRVDNGMLEIMGHIVPLASVRKVSVRLLQKERLDANGD